MIGTPRECPVGLAAGRFVKIALVAFFKSRTVVTNLWIAWRLQMGDPSMGSRYCRDRDDVGKISKRIEKAGSKNCPH